jgi:hypothetical protein
MESRLKSHLSGITENARRAPEGCYLYLGDDLDGEAENSETTSCAGAYDLCPGGCPDTVPLLTASATDGNIYANVIQEDIDASLHSRYSSQGL